jgi:hypothetical protein
MAAKSMSPFSGNGGAGLLPLVRLPLPPVSKLETAECTVVDRTADEKQQPAKGIFGHRVNPVFSRKTAQFSRTALRTLAITSEQSKERPPPVTPLTAIFALVDGAIDSLLKNIAGSSSHRTAAGSTHWHRL